MNYTKALLITVISAITTVTSVSAMEITPAQQQKQPAPKFITSSEANTSGPGEDKTWLNRVSGSGGNIVFVPNSKRTKEVNPQSQLQPKKQPTSTQVNTTKTTSIFSKKQPNNTSPSKK